jgi:hypothetical protein
MATNIKDKQKLLNLQLRQVMSDAYTFVRSRQYTETVANITYEELLDAAIGKIEGTSGRSDVRATRLDRVQKLKEQISSAVTNIKKRPPQEWAIESDDNVADRDAANTPEE